MNKEDRRGLRNLVKQLGAEVMLERREREMLEGKALVRARLATEDGVLGGEWPAGDPRLALRAAVVVPGDIPGNQVAVLRRALRAGGLGRDEVVLIPAGAGRGRVEALATLRAANCLGLLLVGVEGVKLWRADMQLRQFTAGKGAYPAVVDGMQFFAGVVETPGAVMRGTVDGREWAARVAGWIERLGSAEEKWKDGESWWDEISWACRSWDKAGERVCGAQVWTWDRLGAPWCEKHHESGWGKSEGQMAKQVKQIRNETQGVLL